MKYVYKLKCTKLQVIKNLTQKPETWEISSAGLARFKHSVGNMPPTPKKNVVLAS